MDCSRCTLKRPEDISKDIRESRGKMCETLLLTSHVAAVSTGLQDPRRVCQWSGGAKGPLSVRADTVLKWIGLVQHQSPHISSGQ